MISLCVYQLESCLGLKGGHKNRLRMMIRTVYRSVPYTSGLLADAAVTLPSPKLPKMCLVGR